MTKPLVPRAQARTDVDLAIDYYVTEAGADVALRFIDAIEQAFALIGEAPAMGSPRWSHELNLPGLRSVQLKGFPWLVYLEFEAHVDVWRLLHGKRDLPAGLNDADDE